MISSQEAGAIGGLRYASFVPASGRLPDCSKEVTKHGIQDYILDCKNSRFHYCLLQKRLLRLDDGSIADDDSSLATRDPAPRAKELSEKISQK